MSSVINFPAWKMNCTPIEKLREMLQYAESHPEDVRSVMILYRDEEGIRQSQSCGTLTVCEAVFQLEQAKFDLMKVM